MKRRVYKNIIKDEGEFFDKIYENENNKKQLVKKENVSDVKNIKENVKK